MNFIAVNGSNGQMTLLNLDHVIQIYSFDGETFADTVLNESQKIGIPFDELADKIAIMQKKK